MNRYLIVPGIGCGLAFVLLFVSFSQSSERAERASLAKSDGVANVVPDDGAPVQTQAIQQDASLLDRDAANALLQRQVLEPMQFAASNRRIMSRAAPRPTKIQSTFELAELTERGALFCGMTTSTRGKISQQLPFVIDRTNGTILLLVGGKWESAATWQERHAKLNSFPTKKG